MEASRIIACFLISLGLQALAVQRQRGTWIDDEFCDTVSFNETGRNDRYFLEEEVSKGCYNIDSDTPTATALVLNKLRCKYTVKKFPVRDCNRRFSFTKQNWDNKNHVVHLNRLPICSFSVDFLPIDGTPIVVEFSETRRSSNFSMTQGRRRNEQCQTICDGNSNFHYPDTVKLYHNENLARGYYVNLFSKPGCTAKITKIDDEIVMETQGLLHLSTITQLKQTISYEIYSFNPNENFRTGFVL